MIIFKIMFNFQTYVQFSYNYQVLQGPTWSRNYKSPYSPPTSHSPPTRFIMFSSLTI
jgi:hypothetical protein